MKKLLFIAVMLIGAVANAGAQAEIKFDKVNFNFGTFSEKNGVQKTSFTFTNTGNKPLVINQIVASCGCTTPNYDKKPIAPGQKNGKGKLTGHFKKSITVYSNAATEMTRLYIEGEMTD